MFERILKLKNKLFLEYKLLTSKALPVVFDHLPKCGGTSVNYFLKNAYPKRASFNLNIDSPIKSTEEFKNFNLRKRQKTKLVYGHLANELRDFVNPESIWAVVVREPVDRIISHYFFVKRNKKHYLHEEVEEKNISLEEYCYHNLSYELEKFYVAHFSGLSSLEIQRNPQIAV